MGFAEKIASVPCGRWVVAGAVVATSLLFAGCGAASPSSAAAGGDMPAFSGPYAAELEQAWRESDSDFVRQVIADEVVSDQEWAELDTRMTECLARSGLEFGGFDDHGTYTVGPSQLSGEALSRVVDACEINSGEVWVHALRLAMNANPENRPIAEIMTECLVRNGALSPGYSPEWFDRDSESMTFPFLNGGSRIFWLCNDDPQYADAGPPARA